MSTTNSDAFLDLITDSLQQNNFVKLSLSQYRGAEAGLQRLVIRPIMLRQQIVLSFVYSYKTRDITKNQSLAESPAILSQMLGADFKRAFLLTEENESEFAQSKKGQVTIRTKKIKPIISQPFEHNREKKRYVDINRPFLTELKITDKQNQLIPAMSRKWKQINKFIEVFSQALQESPLSKRDEQSNRPIQVVDFGSGKGYLTFAIHDYLRNSLKNESEVIGVELRENLTNLCNDTASKLDHQGLSFVCGDVKTHAPKQTDVMIALHACDVATDYAINYGIRADASIIMCSPCCHKEIRPQIKMPELFKPMLQYGVHLGQEAEMITDSLRALLLEANGYSTKVFEFISLEHTNKNKMILATKKRKAGDNSEVLKQIVALKSFYGINNHCLEDLLSEK